MKRAIFALFLFIASAAFGDEREEKRQLVSELLEVMDAKSLTQAAFTNLLLSAQEMFNESSVSEAELPEEYRAEIEEEERKRAAEMREFQERLFARLDYGKFFDAAYVPLFDDSFTTEELRQLIAFFKTRPGQKLLQVMPQLSGVALGWQHLYEAGEAAEQEQKKQEAAKHPWRQTMADMRSIATAVEAHGVDTEKYPAVAFEELEAAIAPTYIREVPKVDAWGTPFEYVSDGKHYRVVSAGADKRFEWSSRQLDLTIAQPRLSDSLDADIIFQDGNFVQWPKVADER